METKCFFYLRDGWMMEIVRNLENTLEDQTLQKFAYSPDYSKIESVDTTFRCVACFMISRKRIAYYEEI